MVRKPVEPRRVCATRRDSPPAAVISPRGSSQTSAPSWLWLASLVAALALLAGGPRALAQSDDPLPKANPSIVSWLTALPSRDVKAASFLEITPGVATRKQVVELVPALRDVAGDEKAEVWSIALEPFRRVAISFQDDVVARVRVEFAQPRPLRLVKDELRLDRFTLAPGLESPDATLAMVVPERGLKLLLTGKEGEEEQVSVIELYVPQAEDFVLRAYRQDAWGVQEQLADLEQALRMDATCSTALVGIGRCWEQIGYAEEALDRLSKASISHPAVRVEQARLAVLVGRQEQALKWLEEVSLHATQPSVVQGKAWLVRAAARHLARAAPPNQVLEDYIRAIQLIQKALPQATLAETYQARQALLEAYLGAAMLIASSNFQNRSESVTRWIEQAQTVVAHAERQGERWYAGRAALWLGKLACHLRCTQPSLDDLSLDKLRSWGDEFLAKADDPFADRMAKRMYGELLLRWSEVQLAAGMTDEAMAGLQQAALLLSDTAQQQPPYPLGEVLLGQTLYLRGAVEAIARKNHAAAVDWYNRAAPLLATTPAYRIEPQRLADQWVSMGVSYWHVGERKIGLEYTQRGWQLYEQLIRRGEAAGAPYQVACSNLAFMYEAMGDAEKARHMAELARSPGPTTQTPSGTPSPR